MPKTAALGTFVPLTLDNASGVPLYRQIYEAVRQAILGGRLGAGTRLPATRSLAGELGVSRNTILLAFEQLLAEGYLEGKVGSGTYVSGVLPDAFFQAPDTAGARPRAAPRRAPLSRRGRMLASTPAPVVGEFSAPRPFQTRYPAFDAFPHALWGRLVGRRWRSKPVPFMGYGEPAGYRPLRRAIADYLRGVRGVCCEPDQVVITAGSLRALELAARLLLDPGDAVWIEDPSDLRAYGTLLSLGARPVPVPVDDEGLDVAAGVARCPGARMAYVAPAHQDPLGITMSLTRRLALLDWARGANAYVMEDDYDSEFRYHGRPLGAMQGQDRHGKVLFIGNFGKVLFPSVRLGYLVVPPDLVEPFLNARAVADWHPVSVDQAVVADFITQGHFAQHLRRMRTLYAERQAVMVEAARRVLGGLLEVRPAEAGTHLIGWLPKGMSDQAASQAAAAHGVVAPPLSACYMEAKCEGGLLLGYAALSTRQIWEGVRRLATALRSCRGGCHAIS